MAEEKEKTVEERLNDVGRWIGSHITTIFAVLIALFFIFNGTVKVLPTELGITERITMAILTIIAGYSITNLIGEQGFGSAKRSDDFKREKKAYEDSVAGAVKYREAIDEFAYEKAQNNLKNIRICLCESAGLYYFDIFDDKGDLKKDFDITIYKKKNNHYHKIYRAYRKAVRLRVQDTSVFSHSGSSKFGIKKRKTEQGYRTKKGITGAVIKVVFGITSIGVMFVFIGWSWGSIIYAFMQVVIWAGMGVIDRQKNHNFMMEEILPQYTDDRLIIDEFMKKNEDDKNTYVKRATEKHNQKTKEKENEIKQITMIQ